MWKSIEITNPDGSKTIQSTRILYPGEGSVKQTITERAIHDHGSNH